MIIKIIQIHGLSGKTMRIMQDQQRERYKRTKEKSLKWQTQKRSWPITYMVCYLCRQCKSSYTLAGRKNVVQTTGCVDVVPAMGLVASTERYRIFFKHSWWRELCWQGPLTLADPEWWGTRSICSLTSQWYASRWCTGRGSGKGHNTLFRSSPPILTSTHR